MCMTPGCTGGGSYGKSMGHSKTKMTPSNFTPKKGLPKGWNVPSNNNAGFGTPKVTMSFSGRKR